MFVSPTKCASPTINPWRRHWKLAVFWSWCVRVRYSPERVIPVPYQALRVRGETPRAAAAHPKWDANLMHKGAKCARTRAVNFQNVHLCELRTGCEPRLVYATRRAEARARATQHPVIFSRLTVHDKSNPGYGRAKLSTKLSKEVYSLHLMP